jgi:CheY-like chemotaxis protein
VGRGHPSEEREPGDGKPRILVIDNEPSIVGLVVRLLTPECVVETVTRTADAIHLLNLGASFDLILCELMLPELAVSTFALQLESHPPQAKKLAFFSWCHSLDDDLVSAAASHGLLRKVFRLHELRDVVLCGARRYAS